MHSLWQEPLHLSHDFRQDLQHFRFLCVFGGRGGGKNGSKGYDTGSKCEKGNGYGSGATGGSELPVFSTGTKYGKDAVALRQNTPLTDS